MPVETLPDWYPKLFAKEAKQDMLYGEIVKKAYEETLKELQRITRYDFFEAVWFAGGEWDQNEMVLVKPVADWILVRRIDLWNTTTAVGTYLIKAYDTPIIQGALEANGGHEHFNVSFRVPTTKTLPIVVSNVAVNTLSYVETTKRNYCGSSIYPVVPTADTNPERMCDQHRGTFSESEAIGVGSTIYVEKELAKLDLGATRHIDWACVKFYAWIRSAMEAQLKWQYSVDGVSWVDIESWTIPALTEWTKTFWLSKHIATDVRYFRVWVKGSEVAGTRFALNRLFEFVGWGD